MGRPLSFRSVQQDLSGLQRDRPQDQEWVVEASSEVQDIA